MYLLIPVAAVAMYFAYCLGRRVERRRMLRASSPILIVNKQAWGDEMRVLSVGVN